MCSDRPLAGVFFNLRFADVHGIAIHDDQKQFQEGRGRPGEPIGKQIRKQATTEEKPCVILFQP